MVVLGIVVELIYKIGLGSVVASFAGFVTLLIAHNLALGGDTMEMMRAVLDNNFWLSTHVVVVTLGYASTFFAGLLAIVFILMGLFSGIVSQPLTLASSDAGGKAKGATQAGSILLGKALSKMIYGVVCFATLFSFVGTVLGGIWADQSWGRFWGWDPKENGALLIVLWNAMILHSRWGGLVRERGIVNLAIIGNIVTSFSWFGVNLLGIGLHSYGFTDTGAEYLMNFVGSQLLLLGNGLFPLVFWKSFSQGAPAPGIVRAFLGMLNISWLVTAIIWFIGVYYEKPTAAAAGKIGSIAAIALVWLLAGVAKYITRPRQQMPRVATATAGG